ncbi:MAG TPA: chemotaxis protein CheB [Steroidobacteraceae bacterium]|nr:chemotaxis protein CheB [Steroidobacteraceae bacterium]
MDTSPVIVAVASSAEDLEAVCELLSALPAECGAAFVIVQHLDPSRERVLFETLSRRVALAVMSAQDGLAAEPRHVYLVSANTTLTISGGRIRVTPNPGGLHHPGDILLTSVAEDQGRGAVGVVLSGAGSDGALGLQAIERAGGAAFAQYPGSARFPSMPISAIETGCVQFVLRPNEIARELALLSRKAGDAPGLPDGQAVMPGLSRPSGVTTTPASRPLFAHPASTERL